MAELAHRIPQRLLPKWNMNNVRAVAGYPGSEHPRPQPFQLMRRHDVVGVIGIGSNNRNLAIIYRILDFEGHPITVESSRLAYKQDHILGAAEALF